MSSNFLDESGVTFSVYCQHSYYKFDSILSPNTEVKDVPHLWGGSLSVDDSNGKLTATVTSEGNRMCQEGYKRQKLFHVPFPPGPPGPKELMQLKELYDKSFSEPCLATSTVIGQGTPLTATIIWIIGISQTCGGPGGIIQFNSVKTTPTVGDYLDVILDFLIPYLKKLLKKFLKEALDKLIDLVDKLFKRTLVGIFLGWLAKIVLKFLAKHLIHPLIDFVVDELGDLIHDKLPELVDKHVVPLFQQHVLDQSINTAQNMQEAAQSLRGDAPATDATQQTQAVEGWVDALL